MKGKGLLTTLLMALQIAVMILVFLGFYTLVWWGIGSLITSAFEISFYWKPIHGFCIAALSLIIMLFFKGSGSNN